MRASHSDYVVRVFTTLGTKAQKDDPQTGRCQKCGGGGDCK